MIVLSSLRVGLNEVLHQRMAITMKWISRLTFPKAVTRLPSSPGIGAGMPSAMSTAEGRALFLKLMWMATRYSAIRRGRPRVILHMVHHRLHIQITVLPSSMFTSMRVRTYQGGNVLISTIQAGLQ